ncbi:hypothetical protein [Streptomyces sp. NPDC091219]|uniref:hypothetical protein n=1 Tax=Streptomyces sp. NPDC091219 TaxID=3155193 RepID=UPI00344C2611
MNRLTSVAARRARRTLLAVTVAATAVTGPLWVASSGPTGATTATAATSALAMAVADTDPHMLPAWIPTDLRTDLRQLRGMDPEQRQKAATRIWQDALDGDYGTVVKLRAERAQQRYRLLPEQLRDELGELRGLTGDELRDGLVDIRDKALDGGYGDQVRHWAERRSGFWQQH